MIVNEWPPDGLDDVPACPVCGSFSRSTVEANLTDKIFHCAPGTWQLRQCNQCGSAYLDPRPSRDAIHLAYAQYFTHDRTKNPQEQLTSVVNKTLRSCANGYRNWRYGTNNHPALTIGVWAAMALPPAKSLIDAGMRYLPPGPSGRRLLDVGAGNGAFLSRAKSAGWDTLGVEPDPVAASVAQRAGLDIRIGGIECLTAEDGEFDFVTMNHVIEHVHDPVAVLRTAFSLLRPGGTLFLETPNINSAGFRRFGANWRGLEPPRHLVLFNWNSLKVTLIELGFVNLRRRYRFGIYPEMAAKSRAISDDGDSESARNSTALVSFLDRLQELVLMPWARRSEFITMLAKRPLDE